MTTLRSLTLAFLVVLMGTACATAPPIEPPAPVEDSGWIDAGALLAEYGALIPRDTVIFGALNVGYLWRTGILSGAGVMPERWDSTKMVEEVSLFSTSRIGLDVTKIETLMVAASDSDQVVLLLAGDFDAPVNKPGAEITFVRTGRPGVASPAFDNEHAAALGDLFSGQAPTMAEPASQTALRTVLDKSGPGVLVVGAQVGDGKLSQEFTEALPVVPATAAASFGDEISVVVGGDPKTLDTLNKLLQGALAALSANMQQQLMGLDQMDFVEGLTVITGAHLLDGLTMALTPTIEGEFMSVRLSSPNVGGVVPMLGMSAAIAVPAFIKYLDLAKASEQMSVAPEAPAVISPQL